MKNCPSCDAGLTKKDETYCTSCGHQLVATADLPTLDLNEQTLLMKKISSQNLKLRLKVADLEKQVESVFGGTPEPVEKRLSRILQILGFERSAIPSFRRWYVDEETSEDKWYNVRLIKSLGNFLPYEFDDDENVEFLYVATYKSAVDLENELADIRVVLGDCAAKDVGCIFVISTNEDLKKHKKRAMAAFDEMKTFLPKRKQSVYSLEIWDKEGILEKEYECKIRGRARAARARKPKDEP
jgi:hypothetical protein